MSNTFWDHTVAPAGRPCCHPLCSREAISYTHLLAAHAPTRPLLTPAGEAFLRNLLQAPEGDDVPNPYGRPTPQWDADARCLWLGDRLLKAFRQPAPYQTALLAAFEEGGWAAGHVDDPIPPESGEESTDARKRLRETVHNLNRGLPAGTIRFRGDGTGEGVRWEWCDTVGTD